MEYLKSTVGYQMMLLKENIIETTKAEFQKSGITHEEYTETIMSSVRELISLSRKVWLNEDAEVKTDGRFVFT